MTSTLGRDDTGVDAGEPPSPLRRLAERVGIMSEYVDQTGHTKYASDETRRALLATLGIDASSDEAVHEALERLVREERGEMLPPVRVVRRSSSSSSTCAVRLPVGGARSGAWRLELTTEHDDRAVLEGSWVGGPILEIALPSGLPLGYHHLRVTLASNDGVRGNDQTLIVVPDRCVVPADLVGDRGAFGLITNLYTLRSESNWGVGDFTDLTTLAEWAGGLGADFVGVNPLHTLLNRGMDVSPYSPVSRLFRNPIYIDVRQVPELRDAPNVHDHLTAPELQSELEALRESPAVRYEQVMGVKGLALDALHRVFEQRVRGSGDHRGREYEAFVAATDPALTRFATWMTIAESPGRGFDWHQWPPELRHHTSDAVRDFADHHAHRVDYHRWVQFEADRQLGLAAEAARDAGMRIGLYPDLAIGTAPGGADTWMFPELFVRGAGVGAPPDPYAAQGQNWGLPPIDPRALRRNRYEYFVNLLRSAFRHAGALRIDHVLGLFRLFWIPNGRSGAEGAYLRYPAEDLLGILALESVRHRAVVIGEDLGTVPPEVPPALAQWGVLSSKVLQFERGMGGAYNPARSYPSLALATADTHDMVSITGFWAGRDIEVRRAVGLIDDSEAERAELDRVNDRAALVRALASEGALPDERAPASPAELRGAVHAFLCCSPAQLVGVALDDLTGELDPVNVPGVGPDKYPSWTRKMREPLETIMISDDVRAALGCEARARREEIDSTRDP